MAALGGNIANKRNAHELIYIEIRKTLNEEDLIGIQLYPAGWPRKLQITVDKIEVKEKLVIEGIDIFGKHVEMRDEDNSLLKVVLKDAPLEWSNDIISDLFVEYGEVIRTEYEYIYVDGVKTTCSTGNRFLYLSNVKSHIPTSLTTTVDKLTLTVTTWYRGQESDSAQTKTQTQCFQCGSVDHGTKYCTYKNKVCFICQDANHSQKDCPKDNGTKTSETATVFLNSKSVFSNWSIDNPFEFDGETYSCVEQYCMKRKCDLFGDHDAGQRVMRETQPRNMKTIGDRIDNYDHRLWVDVQRSIVTEGVRAKFSQNEDAREELLNTTNTIGEATTNKIWGIGIHISDQNCVNTSQWVGDNRMGHILMEIREELKNKGVKEVLAEIDEVLGKHENVGRGEQKTTHKADDSIEISDETDENEERNDESIIIDKPLALILGDSNIAGMNFDDADLPVDVKVVANGGTKLENIKDKIEKCEFTAEEVRVVVMHIGTCEWSSNAAHVVPADNIYMHYIEALNTVSEKYPHAELSLSGIPPRSCKGQHGAKAEGINIQVTELNKRLARLSNTEENIMYIDNDKDMKEKNTGLPSIYTDTVHLNKKGRAFLKTNIIEGIKEGYAKNGLRTEWGIAPGRLTP